MGWATLIMGGSILLSRFMGLIRDKTISYLFGATQESDLYFAAFVIPDFINYLLAGAYFSITLIPLLTVYFEENEEEGWRFFSAVLVWLSLFIGILTALGMVFAPRLAYLAAPGLSTEALGRLALFLRIVFPAQVCFLLGSCFSALLYLRKQFLIPALVPLTYNLLIILGGVLLRVRGMEGFCWGVLAGAFLGNLCLPWMAARGGGGVKLRLVVYHPGLKKFLLLALPLMLGQSIVVLDEQLIRVFGSLAGVGAISWLNYSRRIMLVPVGVVAQAAGVASYPFLAELAAKQEFSKFCEALNKALLGVMTLLVPLSLWMMAVSEPTIRLIFQQGHFSPSDTGHTAFLLQLLLSSVFCWGVQQILGRAFYALQDTVTPVVLGTLTTVISIPAFAFLAQRWQTVGVALASVASITLYTVVLAGWWRRRFGKGAFSGLGGSFLKVLALSLMALGPAILIVRSEMMDRVRHPYVDALLVILASGVCFGMVFAVLAARFIPSLVQPFLKRMGPLGLRLIRN